MKHTTIFSALSIFTILTLTPTLAMAHNPEKCAAKCEKRCSQLSLDNQTCRCFCEKYQLNVGHHC